MNKHLIKTKLSCLSILAALAASGCSSGSSSSPSGSPAGGTSAPAASVSLPSVASSNPGLAAPTSAAVSGVSAPATTSGAAGSSAKAASQTPVPAEQNPPGDIPDNVAFVPYDNAAGHYHLTHPEGWAEATTGSTVTFTDKLNGLQASVGTDTTAPTEAVAKQRDVPQLTSTEAAFELRSVKAVTEPAGAGVLIVYRRKSAPDPVTGRQYRDEVQRYELVGHGHSIVIELFGPVGADNVDAYHTMIQSLRLS